MKEKEVKLIEIEEEIHADNTCTAGEVRSILDTTGTKMVNIMASPGAGKTSLILRTAEALRSRYRIAVIEADMDSSVDAEIITEHGFEAAQIRTGGFCHVEARMIKKTLQSMDLEQIDLLFLENVGNLICPAQFETGAQLNVMILSVPEGDDKPLKYPLMFRICEVLVINKTDYLGVADFDVNAVRERVRKLNPDMEVFEVSSKTGEGIAAWSRRLSERPTLL